ncbi:MAG: hypothetical protein FJ267_20450, partial [Planctomycetes bacterium]|nr:hypothetical protein [Planctomycetota bacterium]
MRSEALQLAEQTPNLLDVVAVLDFAERDQLIDVVNMYFFTPPEPLLLDVASVLNEAYAQHEPLQKLLDSHRLLALGRSPLSQRLSVLRSLASLDESSPHWDLDVREMERARLRELESDSRSAVQRQDATALKTLLGEAQAEGWREDVPASLLRDLKSRVNQVVRRNARQRMEQLNAELYSAFSALDPDRARPLRDEWNQKQKIVQAPSSEPVFEQVAPI